MRAETYAPDRFLYLCMLQAATAHASYDHKIRQRLRKRGTLRKHVMAHDEEVKNTSEFLRSVEYSRRIRLPRQVGSKESYSKCSRFIEVSVCDTEGVLGFSGSRRLGEGHTNTGYVHLRYNTDGSRHICVYMRNTCSVYDTLVAGLWTIDDSVIVKVLISVSNN